VGIGAAWEQIEARIFERTVAAARAGLNQAAFDAAWFEGTRMALDQAIADASIG
jgi:hypothetical protein